MDQPGGGVFLSLEIRWYFLEENKNRSDPLPVCFLLHTQL